MLALVDYKVIKQIYESTDSIIYRGIRNKDGLPVILKVLRKDYPTPEDISRYQQEHAITQQLALTGVINTYEIINYENTLIIVLEDFGGKSLKQCILDNPLSIPIFLQYALNITDTIAHIHAAHIIHKDINPGNILLNPHTGQLKIIDFGIASRLPRENTGLKHPERLEGTLVYISPEQTGRTNRSLDYRTDLYSLGMTFYKLLTGQVAFNTTDPMELVHCHIAKPPRPVIDINPDVPPILSMIIMKLLEKNKEDRYQSAWGLKADLEKCIAHTKKLFNKNLASVDFELAQQDMSSQFQVPQKLYGRDQDSATLLHAFERVSEGHSELVLVAGYSGVGKSALVHEVHKPMTARRGNFTSGKFDQLQKNIPYYAITHAFNQFCRYLLMENTENLAQWKHKILKAVGGNGQVIIDIIPDLELVIGEQMPLPQMGAAEAQNRFQVVFLNFVKALCSKTHPFILFIDDLQWVDSASLTLLKAIMLDRHINHLLVIGAYRDNEVDAHHPVINMVEEVRDSSVPINTITLGNLTAVNVRQLIAETVHEELSTVQALTTLVYKKTAGNAFFTHEFLKSLYEKELLFFDNTQQKWQWDSTTIATLEMTDNVVDLMAAKIANLSPATQKVLKLAACIGSQFDINTLSIIYQNPSLLTIAHLWEAIEQSLIEPLDDNYKQQGNTDNTGNSAYFKFQHDRVQQAAYSLINKADKAAVHWQIGQLLLENVEDKEEQLFAIIDHLNQGSTSKNALTQHIEVINLNLHAGQSALASSAFGMAYTYFKKGIDTLPTECWQTHYQLTVDLHIGAAEAACLNTDFDTMKCIVDSVLPKISTIMDKIKFYELLILYYHTQSHFREAVETAVHILAQLDEHFPENPDTDDFVATLTDTFAKIETIGFENLTQLPALTDPQKYAAINILRKALYPSYFAVPEMLGLFICRLITLTIDYGETPLTPVAFSAFSVLLNGGLSDIPNGSKFGELALQHYQNDNDTFYQADVYNFYYGLSRHFYKPINECIEPLFEGYLSFADSGNAESCAYCLINSYVCSILSGQNLQSISQKFAAHIQYAPKLKQAQVIHQLYIWTQVIANLTEGEAYTANLTGDWFDSDTLLPKLVANKNFNTFNYANVAQLMLFFLFEEPEKAYQTAVKTEPHLPSSTGKVFIPAHNFYYSLSIAACYESSTDKAADLEKLDANQQQMQLWATHCPENFQHQYLLVKAEIARIQAADIGQIMQYYDQAIEAAKAQSAIHHEALANELAARFWLAQGKEAFARIYMTNAYYAYQQWGAHSKVSQLAKKYTALIILPAQNDAYPLTEATLIASGVNQAQTSTLLDLDSVTKATQTLAGEIVLSQLLEKTLRTLIENAGAERGLLILEKTKGQLDWVIEAEGMANNPYVTLLKSLALVGRVPTTIVNYVARTCEAVVLTHAQQNGIYTEDTYIQQHKLKSVLCSPILHQGQLIGLLYLENNLIEGAFTPARLKVLDMLSTQAAISLENSLLYHTLEQKVNERTSQLAEANQEITLLNQRLEKENVRMGTELDVAKRLQQMVLPKAHELAEIPCLDIVGFMKPADEIGGDYYEVLHHNGQVKIGIGDVTGHGLESGVLMLMLQTTVRALLLANITDPKTFLSIVNSTLYYNTQRIETDKNLTLSLLDYQDGHLRITGQHEDILVVRDNGEIERIDTFKLGFNVGLLDNIDQFIAEHEVSLQKGDGVVLYTDGITEAFNIQEEEYGLDRLCDVIRLNWSKSVEEIQQAISHDVQAHIGSQNVYDDITLLILKQK